MTYETIRFETGEDGVARVTLNRPSSANAFSLLLAQELADIALRCGTDPAVRCVLLTGEGRFFTAGGDLSEFAAAEHMDRQLAQTTLHLHAAVARFHRMDPPLVVAINGTAAGGGFSLAITGDVVLAASSAKLTMGYDKIGLSPDGTSSYFLPRLVGLRRAQELMLTGRVLSADEALEWGLVTSVVPDEQLAEASDTLAIRLASGPTRAFGGAKTLLTTAYTTSLETQAELESRMIAHLSRSDDAREGIQAFFAKRKPEFKGR